MEDGGSVTLLERDAELAAARAVVDAAAAGHGAAVLVEAPAGLGKTSLLTRVADDAGARGVTVLRGTGGRLEREHPWGVARALLGVEVDQSDDGAPSPDERVLRVAHALTDDVARRAGAAPLLLVLDDAHWIDAATLRFVAYLLERLPEIGAGLLVAARPAGPLLAHVAAHRTVRHIRLDPLSPAAVEQLAGAGLAAELHRLTAGNPFLVDRLRRIAAAEQAAGRPLDPTRLRDLGARDLDAQVAVELAGRGPQAVRVAEAVAVLGDEATVHRVARLAEVDEAAAAEAVDALAQAELLRAGEPLTFVHPLVAAAVHAAVPAARAADRHAQAARLLGEEGADAGTVAVHLLRAPRRADPWVVAWLRRAAGQASRTGAVDDARRLLDRALAEPPDAATRGALLVDLARVQAAAGDEDAGATFDRAMALLADPRERALARRDQGRWLYMRGRGREAARTYELARTELRAAFPDSPLDQELRAAYLSAAQFDVDLRPLIEDEMQALLAGDTPGKMPAERKLLAQLALHQAFAGAPRERVRRLCDRAWSAGALLADEGLAGETWTFVCGALYYVGDLERELEVLAVAGAEAERTGSPLGRATVAWCSAPPLLHRGDVTAALANAEAALDARRFGWARHLGSLHRVHARCLVERGDLDAAERTVASIIDEPVLRQTGEWTSLLEIQGRLRLLRGDADGALADFEAAGVRAAQFSFAVLPTIVPWRSSAAMARHALGHRDAALALLAEELELAERAGVDRAISTALRLRGLVAGGTDGLASLQAAVDVFTHEHPRLERTAAQLDLGAALRRAGRRREAEPPLRAALAAALQGGATAMAERARTELAALGARVRRASDADRDLLTPSERRVAHLAASGATNREIAHALHVTPKTVEYHLRETFRKLGIRRRTELAAALDP